MAIDLYTWGTTNGRKVSIMLEEVGADYRVHPIDITRGAQLAPGYLAINPNGRIPAIIDRDCGDGEPLVLFESGAILIYLARKYRTLWPANEATQAVVLQWLMFQMSGIGPMFGQLHYFKRFAPDETYALDRYRGEVHRLYGVLDRRLAACEYIAGRDYGIADVATFPWIARFALHDLAWDHIPNVARWFDAVTTKPAVIGGMAVPAL